MLEEQKQKPIKKKKKKKEKAKPTWIMDSVWTNDCSDLRMRLFKSSAFSFSIAGRLPSTFFFSIFTVLRWFVDSKQDPSMNQVTFAGASNCPAFLLNKMRLNARNAKVVCADCGDQLLNHKEEAVKESDILAYLAHIEGHDGGNCILSKEEESGELWCGGRGVSLRGFVEKHDIGAVINASNLHLEARRDFQEWAKKVEKIEKEGLIEVLRMGWEDAETQTLDGLDKAVRWLHQKRDEEKKNVVVHCAQGKSRSGAIIVAYLMCKEKLPYAEGLKMAQLKRNIIQPNAAFAVELQNRSEEILSLF
jgi:hypothetical protein